MPVFALFFVFSMLSSVGLPGLNGFVGEFMILAGSFEANPFWGTVGVTGVIFGAIYLLSVTRRLLFGPLTRKENEELQDLNIREIGLMIPLCALCVWIGFQPNAFLDNVEGSLDQLMDRIESVEPAPAALLDLSSQAPLSLDRVEAAR